MSLIKLLKCAVAGTALSVLGVANVLASPLEDAVDEIHTSLESAIQEAGLSMVASIDHARLATAEGVDMPPSRVQIFSDPAINTPILAETVRAGLDLPFRVLAYGQDGTAEAMYTDADFLQIRHGLKDTDALAAFNSRIVGLTDPIKASAAPTDELTLDYGIIELRSALSVPEAVAKLTAAVRAQDDTIWFGEIDLSAQASQNGKTLPEAILLFFGGPKPGGVAMAQFPAIGLDAFCQKLLVYAGKDGGSVVIFNDIAALAELHYGTSAKPHHALNERLTATFESAIQ